MKNLKCNKIPLLFYSLGLSLLGFVVFIHFVPIVDFFGTGESPNYIDNDFQFLIVLQGLCSCFLGFLFSLKKQWLSLIVILGHCCLVLILCGSILFILNAYGLRYSTRTVGVLNAGAFYLSVFIPIVMLIQVASQKIAEYLKNRA